MMTQGMLIGHERNIRYLERLFTKGAIPHAFLFTGPSGVGKRTVALAFAAGLLCERGRRFSGCGACDACAAMTARSHPDLVFISRDSPFVGGAGSQELGIAEVRELRRRLSLGAWAGGWRIAIFDDADRLTREAQSALLKLLEEPGANTSIILIAESPGALFDTIRSRAIPLSFNRVSDSSMRALVARAAARDREILLELAAGRPGVAIGLMDKREVLEDAIQTRSVFRRLRRASLADLFAFSDAVRNEPERLSAWFRVLVSELRIELVSSATDITRVLSLTELLGETLRAIVLCETTNTNRRLLADAIAFSIAGRDV